MTATSCVSILKKAASSVLCVCVGVCVCVCVCLLPPQYLQQLSDAVVMFCLVDESVKQKQSGHTLVTHRHQCRVHPVSPL